MRVILAVVALLLSPNDRAASGMGGLAWAEDAALVTNARVRVTAPAIADRRLVGRLVAANESSLTLAVGRKTVIVPRQALTRLEVSRRPSRKGGWAGIGLVVGGASGAILGYGAVARGPAVLCSLPCHRDAPENFLVGGALLGAALGTALGAASAPGERWETVGTGRVHARITPVRRGAGVMVTLSF